MTNIIFIDKKLKEIHLYSFEQRLKDFYGFSEFCLPEDCPTYDAHYRPNVSRSAKHGAAKGILDRIHSGNKKTGLILPEGSIQFSDKLDDETKSHLTSTPIFVKSEIAESFPINQFFNSQLNRTVTVSRRNEECNPFGIQSSDGIKYYMTRFSGHDVSIKMDERTTKIIYPHRIMRHIMELSPQGAAYVALVKGKGEILESIPEETLNETFDSLHLSHIQVSFVDFLNSERLVSLLGSHDITGLYGIGAAQLNSYPVLEKTPYKTAINKMNKYLGIDR